MPKRTEWTTVMVDRLKQMWPTKSNAEIIKELGVSYPVIYRKVKELNLPVRNGNQIRWTPDMIQKLTKEFPTRFTRDLAEDLGVSMRTCIRKARELGIDKEDGFLEKNRDEITALATKAKPPHPMKGVKGWCVPNSEKTRFKPGNKPPYISSERRRSIRLETIRKEKLRLKYGLHQRTKLKIVNIY